MWIPGQRRVGELAGNFVTASDAGRAARQTP
jgi:hypothetical protein